MGFPGCTSKPWTAPIFSPATARCATAAAYVRGRLGPALVHAHVTRPYSHSLSDDEKLYKTPAERESERSRDPLKRFADLLRARGAATDADLGATPPRSKRRSTKPL